MPGSQIVEALEINPSLLAFKPRQIALLSELPIMKLDNVDSDHKTLVLKPEQKTILFHSIAQYLQRSGFSKTVKKFLSEAKIQKDDLEDSSYELEKIFCKFLDMCNVNEKSKSHKVKDGKVDATNAVGDGKKKKSDKTSKSKNVAEVIDVAVPVDVKSKEKKRTRNDTLDQEKVSPKVLEETDEGKKKKSKRRKSEGFEEPKIGSQKTFVECVNGLPNGSLEEKVEKSAIQKTAKNEQNGSAEPKTVKHFQRVKVDEVVFSDERLKNNSYWAKDGAEIGYGAKAQEILEQVRGRDFRHEKTKKKRGSYRGGQIDLQSHSVKFSYSDEE